MEGTRVAHKYQGARVRSDMCRALGIRRSCTVMEGSWVCGVDREPYARQSCSLSQGLRGRWSALRQSLRTWPSISPSKP